MTADRSTAVVVELSIPTTEFELGEVLGPPRGIEIDLVEFVPVEGDRIPYFWIENGAELFTTFQRQLNDDARVNDVRVVDARERRRLVRIDWEQAPNGFLDACFDGNVMIRQGRGTSERWTFELEFMDHDAVTAFQQRCADESVPFTVHRITDPGLGDSFDPSGLTGPQREALLLAREEGYFDDPRGTTLAELGETLGITRQAVSYRLRAGVRQLIDVTLRGRDTT